MRRASCLAFLVLTACPKPQPATNDAGAAAVETTKFAKAAPVVGAKRRESSELSMTLSMVVDGGKSAASLGESVTRTEEILAVSGEAVSKVRVTFDEVKSTQQPTAIAGKTYLVEAKDGKIEVRDAAGGATSAEEARDVEKYEKGLGKPDPMLAAIPASGVMRHQKVDSIAQAIRKQLEDSGDAMKVKDVVVTFDEARGDEGIFAVTLTLAKDEGPMTMEVALKGDTAVSTKTGSSTRLTLTGPVTVRGGQMVKTEGTGTMTMKTETKPL